jgi:hypothetical protein
MMKNKKIHWKVWFLVGSCGVALVLVFIGGGIYFLNEPKSVASNPNIQKVAGKKAKTNDTLPHTSKEEEKKDIAKEVYAQFDVQSKEEISEKNALPNTSMPKRQEALQTLLASEKEREKTLSEQAKEQEKPKDTTSSAQDNSPSVTPSTPPNVPPVSTPQPHPLPTPSIPSVPVTAPDVSVTSAVIEKGLPLSYERARTLLLVKDSIDKAPMVRIWVDEVNVNKSGNYHLPFEVTNSKGGKTTGTIPITVNARPTLSLTKEEVTFSIGSPTPQWLEYAKAEDEEDGKLIPSVQSEVNMDREGVYSVKFTVKDRHAFTTVKLLTVRIVNTAPTIEEKELTFSILTLPTQEDVVKRLTIQDKEDDEQKKKVNVSFDEQEWAAIQWAVEGEYPLTVFAVDSYGKVTKQTLKIKVKNLPPVLTGIEDCEVLIGESFDPMENVGAVDPEGKNVLVEVTGEVDTQIAGEYELTYLATDEDGESTTKTRKVTVKAKEETENSNVQGQPNQPIAI